MSPPRTVAVVPARYGSSRFPGKPLAELLGRPMIAHVVERAVAAGVFDAVWVATDDERIAAAARQAGAVARMTRADHATGTDRVAEAVADLPGDAIVVNVQGDEPLVPPALLRSIVGTMRDDPRLAIVTAACTDRDAAAFANPNVVKVVTDAAGDALYFSRAAIPYSRRAATSFLRHVGIYGFRCEALQRFVALPPFALEASEGLEQLRALAQGMRIRVLVSELETIGVDTPEDLKAVATRLAGL